ncbi:response regulator containing CheY-like receiver domain and AraC-type DNA-binding domain [Desulfosporosinus orientis DSM 765]|uniref:Response regulator containing CheY-like receiver domain and AraC-type DNA-binding domain n=1 Tax=Desulfosporosinus orientis (strain ATCC 19365 / DSM 765 / NCIMB 8382 / VKM B-1628 / Singapore I) TaxID=768706 RepID=G7WCZ7_DESOD|nr:response regulator containing CheY-like receiver domain and AraC-type DNA-binding domain [Desulfosporosinus orientis DSM 765]
MESSQIVHLRQNFETIQPVLDNFSTLHQLWLKFVSCTGDYILTPKSKTQNNFCSLIRSHPEGLQRCRTSVQQCTHLDPDQAHLFPCHAGLYILAIPLHGEQEFLGAFATGEIRINNMMTESSNILKRVRDLDLNKVKLLQFYEQMPIRKREEMMILGKSLHAISNNFLKLGISCGNALITHNHPAKRASSKTESSLKDYSLSRSNPLVQQAVDYILQNYGQQLTLEEVARQVHLSPAYFSCLFSKEQKQTFSNFLITTRLEKAKELLQQNPFVSISEISQQIGYKDANYFSRVFKEMTGIPPGLYRKSILKNESQQT